eukprot:3826572-Pleurochrysis_carterae.AAC.3
MQHQSSAPWSYNKGEQRHARGERPPGSDLRLLKGGPQLEELVLRGGARPRRRARLLLRAREQRRVFRLALRSRRLRRSTHTVYVTQTARVRNPHRTRESLEPRAHSATITRLGVAGARHDATPGLHGSASPLAPNARSGSSARRTGSARRAAHGLSRAAATLLAREHSSAKADQTTVAKRKRESESIHQWRPHRLACSPRVIRNIRAARTHAWRRRRVRRSRHASCLQHPHLAHLRVGLLA